MLFYYGIKNVIFSFFYECQRFNYNEISWLLHLFLYRKLWLKKKLYTSRLKY